MNEGHLEAHYFCILHGVQTYQMDIKSTFFNGLLKEEVFVRQLPGFESHEFPDHAYKLDKIFYGLKQAPRAW